jgi:hypothetical protein
MSDPRETLALFHRLDAMAARLAPLEPIVSDFERAWDELASVRKSRKGTKATREERAKPIAARMNEAWPLVDRVARSRLLIKKLRDQVQQTEGAQFDFDKAALIDSLWGEIRAIRELVPMAERGERQAQARSDAQQALVAALKETARDRDAELQSAALDLRERNPRLSKTEVARRLAEREGLGGGEAIRKKLSRLLPRK